MTRGTMVSRLVAYGCDWLATTERNDFIDEAVREFDSEAPWPWRITEQTGAEPLTVTLRGPVDSVRNAAGAPIDEIDHDELVTAGKDLTVSGTALYYYVQDGVVKTYPRSSTNITVRHYSLGGWTTGGLSAGSDADTPRAATRWHDAIVLLAVLRVKVFNDDMAEAGSLWERYQARLEQARRVELGDPEAQPGPPPPAEGK